MTKWILIAVAAAVLAWIVYGYNRLIRLRQLAFEGWSGIDVQLKRRAEDGRTTFSSTATSSS